MFKRKGRHWPHNPTSPRHARELITKHQTDGKGGAGK